MDNADEVIKESLNHFFLDIKLDYRQWWKVVILFFAVFTYYVTNAIKQIRVVLLDIYILLKHKKTIRNITNKDDDKWFKDAITLTLNHKETGKHSHRTSKNLKKVIYPDTTCLRFETKLKTW